MTYSEDDMLMLSGIQHICFCQRQWALIHIEKQWEENTLTIDGMFLHEKADNPYLKEKRPGIIISRAMPVSSKMLGLYGVCDIIEFTLSQNEENTIKIPHKKGHWIPAPVEYKNGKPKDIDCDKIQLCAQAMCLEEMYNIEIKEGFIFYNKIKHRELVMFDEILREKTKKYSSLMHELFRKKSVPKAIVSKSCKSCSLIDICMPNFFQLDPLDYMKRNLS